MRAHIEEILSFWFGLSRTDPSAVSERIEMWFQAGEELDATIRRRFGKIYDRVVSGAFDCWESTSRSRLALILLLDQFSRNLFRGTPQAFAQDPRAQRLTLDGIREELDRQLSPIERGFFYMPLQHAEQLKLQEKSVEMYRRLLDEAEPEWRDAIQGMLSHAEQHHAIIERFGRFPHRNAILGRTSTAAETAFLEEGGPTYNQHRATR